MKLSTSTKILIALLPIGLLGLLYVFVFSPEGKNRQAEKKREQSIFLPQTQSDTTESKSAIYDKEKEDFQNRNIENERSSLSVDDIVEITEKSRETGKSERDLLREKLYGNELQENEQKEEIPLNEKPAVSSTTPKTVTKTTASKKTVSSGGKTSVSPISSSPQKETSGNEIGFGVYSGSGSKTTSVVSSVQKQGNSYLTAFLEKNMTIKEGSEVVFVVKEPATVSGVKIEKMAILYGTVSYGNNRYNIHINRVLNTNNKYYDVDLAAYNKNMQKGIYYEGKQDNALNKSVNQGVSTTIDIIAPNKTGNIAKNGSEAVEMEPAINLSQGYVMYFKEN